MVLMSGPWVGVQTLGWTVVRPTLDTGTGVIAPEEVSSFGRPRFFVSSNPLEE